ncbi:hypothetical protein PV10_03773 [Exophiala mesophila]|uniref:Major facilitator superfamily (MFS) profile domain-containing protein n=1 Tax=Exophiala mesophila TaxID=212818 RepID=A0A0D1ZF36_EXOME|nr:uncharacterized protein PV10_03773 [Exophiala mesophila]KIV92479.1 hypothetical protein PV10_03773 [Exophiala mesophila]
MGFKTLWTDSSIVKYGRTLRALPPELFNRHLSISALIYATSSMPGTWDQGSSSVVASLPGFRAHFGISSATDAKAIRHFVSLPYVGMAIGALLSFFLNDRVGRLWAYRIYISVFIFGQMIATASPDVSGLYAARVLGGLGTGALTVTGPMSLVEIAPAEIRGVLTTWFTIAMAMALVAANFCVYGIFKNIPDSRLQYQIVFFAPCIFLASCIVASFFICESPRWLALMERYEDAGQTLAKIRGLPRDHPLVQKELSDIQTSIRREREHHGPKVNAGLTSILKEVFTVKANLRRLQQIVVSYALAQLSGANAVTSYFVPILTLLGVSSGPQQNIFLSGMYGVSKLVFGIMTSFFFVDALGRRKSLFIGIAFQMISDIYLGVYIKFKQDDNANEDSSRAAIALIFLHAFGYAVGLFALPYIFGSELWPNRIRSFGGALSQCLHWLFIYAMIFYTPSLLSDTNNWGAFIFFASWCFIAIIYVFMAVPEVSGLTVEEIETLFEGPWFTAYRRPKKPNPLDGVESDRIETALSEKGEALVKR